jgi:hypothetical protein
MLTAIQRNRLEHLEQNKCILSHFEYDLLFNFIVGARTYRNLSETYLIRARNIPVDFITDDEARYFSGIILNNVWEKYINQQDEKQVLKYEEVKSKCYKMKPKEALLFARFKRAHVFIIPF